MFMNFDCILLELKKKKKKKLFFLNVLLLMYFRYKRSLHFHFFFFFFSKKLFSHFTVDVRLPMTLETFVQNIWLILSSLVFVCMVFPYFLPILVGLAIMFGFIRNIFR